MTLHRLLRTLGYARCLADGKVVCSKLIVSGLLVVASNRIISMYVELGSISDARKVFDHMPQRNVVSWTIMIDLAYQAFSELEELGLASWAALIGGFARHGQGDKAMLLFRELLLFGLRSNEYNFPSVFVVCSTMATVQGGEQLHSLIVKLGFRMSAHIGNAVMDFYSKCGMNWGSEAHGWIIKLSLDTHVVVGSALVDMYTKCGKLKYADEIFKRLPLKNLVSWNNILVGYAQHGFGAEALEIFKRMQEEDIKPNDITYIGILSACNHVGLVDQGQYHFQNMKDYGIIPRIGHYACMVDLFAKAGLTKMACEFIRIMPLKPNKVIWFTLLSGCKKHEDLEIGISTAKYVLELDPEDIKTHVMISAVCADNGMWDAKAGLREVVNIESKKVPGCSWI
ncbi:hypothetical protein Cni_G00789 [Canna indica]|uniref:Pentatricopeptide repeat-containing protein n=1 Tax=Canna indica TaxID=4628 RepID=A0AAQ3JN23_9LILI|nr:hypothetical protein Cni_G00789 [Canna indica]